MADLAPKYPDLRLTIVGVGPLLADLQRQAADLGVAGHIEFAGRVDHDDIAALLDQMVALVMPSLFEGLPLVALEAAWRARPVVGTTAPGLARAVVDGENGLLVDPEDPHALSAAMESLILDRDRAASSAPRPAFGLSRNGRSPPAPTPTKPSIAVSLPSDARGGW